MLGHLCLPSFSSGFVYLTVASSSFIGLWLLYNRYLHPLAKFPGPWYATSTSLSVAIISVLKIEPQWLQGLVKKYGSKLTNKTAFIINKGKVTTNTKFGFLSRNSYPYLTDSFIVSSAVSIEGNIS